MQDLNTYRAEQKRMTYFFIIAAGTPLSAVLHPDYWVHIRGNPNSERGLHNYDLIEIVAADGSYDVTVRIISINKVTGDIKFRILRSWEPEGEAVPITEVKAGRFKAAWIVGNRSWSVQEIATGKYVVEGLADKASAEAEATRLDQERKAA